MIRMFDGLMEEFMANVTSLFRESIFEMVVYDEIERFPSNVDPLFNYPFTLRKNVIQQFAFD